MKRIKTPVWIALIIMILAPIAWAVTSHKSTESQPQSMAESAIVVNAEQVGQQDVPTMLQALGSLSAVQVVTISAEVDGRVAAIDFKNGQRVGKGMPIVQLDNEQAKAAYQTAVTALQLARTKYERSKQLLNTAISQQELDQLKAQVDTMSANVKSKLAGLNQKQVTAPFSGVLGAFRVNVGDYVQAGDPIVTLVSTDQLRVNYSIAESSLPELKTGQLVEVTVGAYPRKTFYGTVSFISPTVNKATRSVAVEALVPNKKNLLSPGMFVHVAQRISIQKNALVVPSQAVLADIKGYYVFRVEDDKALKTYITIGTRINGMVQVLSGLTNKDSVVTNGAQKLEDGSTIKVVQ